MNHETYERLSMDVTPFDAEDIITTSGTGFVPGDYEQIIPIPPGV
ncbi:MAG: hypothetical protein U0L58_03445 [Ruminococcus sp.]|nr:hypothetical protein [Ruminococcus sp.]MEE0856334.1 hypothetical protein [Ruminococcus sp.]